MTRPDPVSLRLPEPLKSSIQQAANQAGRSLSAEIKMRLEWSFEAGFAGEASDHVHERLAKLEQQVAELQQALNMAEDVETESPSKALLEKVRNKDQ